MRQGLWLRGQRAGTADIAPSEEGWEDALTHEMCAMKAAWERRNSWGFAKVSRGCPGRQDNAFTISWHALRCFEKGTLSSNSVSGWEGSDKVKTVDIWVPLDLFFHHCHFSQPLRDLQDSAHSKCSVNTNWLKKWLLPKFLWRLRVSQRY